MVDLGLWAGGEYSVAGEPADDREHPREHPDEHQREHPDRRRRKQKPGAGGTNG
jgi:hypothetical protein